MYKVKQPVSAQQLYTQIIATNQCDSQWNGNAGVAAYKFGVDNGIASFQDSVGQYNLRDQAYQHATPLAIELTRYGIPVSNVGGGNSVVQYRQNVEYEIRKVSSKYANVFRLGVLIGLAEGQTTSPEPAKGLNIANSNLREASGLMNQNLSFISFDQSLMQKALRITGYPLNSSGDAHTAVQQLRFNYEDAVRRSCG